MADWNLFRNRHPDIRGIVGLQGDLSLKDEIIHRSNLELLVRLVPDEVKRKIAMFASSNEVSYKNIVCDFNQGCEHCHISLDSS